MNKNNNFETSSPNVVAFLAANGFIHEKIDDRNGTIFFIFSESQGLMEVVSKYRQNDELKKFLLNLKNVRKFIRNYTDSK